MLYPRTEANKYFKDLTNFPVNPQELTWKYWLIWKVYVAMNDYPKSRRSRASWAQLLDSWDIKDYSGLVRDTIDADCIPLALDVPTQQVSFDNLASISYFMGFTSIKINAERREFSATGILGSITTEDITGYGRVVRFHGNHWQRLCMGAMWPGEWQQDNWGQMVGLFRFDTLESRRGVMIMHQAI